jgi:hypothetical protein
MTREQIAEITHEIREAWAEGDAMRLNDALADLSALSAPPQQGEPISENERIALLRAADELERPSVGMHVEAALIRVLAAHPAAQQGERERALEALYEAVKARSWECPGGVATAYQRVRDLIPPVKETP